MKTRIVRIGNSQGIRIPKPLLRQSGLEGEVEMEVEEGRIVIRATKGVRKGWGEAPMTTKGRPYPSRGGVLRASSNRLQTN